MQWIAAAFGPGVVRPSSPMRGSQETVGPARLPDEQVNPVGQESEDSVEISALGRQAAEQAGLFPTQESPDVSTVRQSEAPEEQAPRWIPVTRSVAGRSTRQRKWHPLKRTRRART